jgi:hypothetical protein
MNYELTTQLTALHLLYSHKDGYEDRPGHPLTGSSYGLSGTTLDLAGATGISMDFATQTVKINLFYDRFHDADLCNMTCTQGWTLPALTGYVEIIIDARSGEIKEYHCGIEWESEDFDSDDEDFDDELDVSLRETELESLREWESKALRTRWEELLKEWHCLFS